MTTSTRETECPLVSVVIPVYNRKNIVLRAIESVLEQDYSNIEIIIVDDGSTDGTSLFIKESMADIRVNLYWQENQGACVARNFGIERAKGKYVALLDSDDVFLQGHIKSSVSVLEREENLTVIYGRIVVDRGNGRTFLKPPRELRSNEVVSEYLLCDQGFIQTSTVVLPRELALNVGYDRNLKFGQDTDFAIRLSRAGANFIMLSDPQAIWADQSAPGRVSNSLDPMIRINWLNKMNGIITRRARIGDEGWYVAKCYFNKGKYIFAAALFLRAVLSGCYHPKLAVRIALQIFLPPTLYRKLADITLSQAKK